MFLFNVYVRVPYGICLSVLQRKQHKWHPEDLFEMYSAQACKKSMPSPVAFCPAVHFLGGILSGSLFSVWHFVWWHFVHTSVHMVVRLLKQLVNHGHSCQEFGVHRWPSCCAKCMQRAIVSFHSFSCLVFVSPCSGHPVHWTAWTLGFCATGRISGKILF